MSHTWYIHSAAVKYSLVWVLLGSCLELDDCDDFV